MLPPLPAFTLPFYTYVGLLLLALFLLGVALAGARLLCLGALLWLSAAWRGCCALLAWCFGAPDTTYGSARWGTRRDLRAAKLLTPDETHLPLASFGQGDVLREPSGGHAMICAPPRAGKSWGTIMPCLRTWPGSCIVTDLRGELFRETGARRAELGTVMAFAPAASESCSINLLDNVRWSSGFEHADVTRIAQHLLAPTGSSTGDDFRRHGVSLLRAAIIHCRRTQQGHFPGVAHFFVEAGTMADKLETLAASDHPTVRQGGQRAVDMPLRLRGNVWGSITEALDIFTDPTIAQHTQHSDLLLGQLLTSASPLTLYLSLEFHDVGRLGKFMGLFIEMLCALVSSPGTTPRHRLLLCLDEMANLSKLNELERAVSYLQGSGCQCLFAWQNIAQVIDLYGETSPLLASVQTSVWYTPTPSDSLTSSHVSTLLGTSTMLHTSSSTSTTPLGLLQGESTSTSPHGRPLLTPDEVRRLPSTDAIVTTTGYPPVLARKLGQPQPALRTRLVTQARAHPGVAASLVAAGLLVGMLHPLWQPAVPQPVVAAQAANAPQATLQALPQDTPPPALSPRARQEQDAAQSLFGTLPRPVQTARQEWVQACLGNQHRWTACMKWLTVPESLLQDSNKGQPPPPPAPAVQGYDTLPRMTPKGTTGR